MQTKYDFIIIGGGPNGLCVAAYLAKAGQKVLVLERYFEVGGGLATKRQVVKAEVVDCPTKTTASVCHYRVHVKS